MQRESPTKERKTIADIWMRFPEKYGTIGLVEVAVSSRNVPVRGGQRGVRATAWKGHMAPKRTCEWPEEAFTHKWIYL